MELSDLVTVFESHFLPLFFIFLPIKIYIIKTYPLFCYNSYIINICDSNFRAVIPFESKLTDPYGTWRYCKTITTCN